MNYFRFTFSLHISLIRMCCNAAIFFCSKSKKTTTKTSSVPFLNKKQNSFIIMNERSVMILVLVRIISSLEILKTCYSHSCAHSKAFCFFLIRHGRLGFKFMHDMTSIEISNHFRMPNQMRRRNFNLNI